MTVFCIILLIFSAVGLTAEIVLRSVLKIKNFGLEKRFFDFHGSDIPAEDFIPHDIFDCLIFAFSFAVLGLILNALTMPWMLTVFCGLIFGCLVLFGRIHWFYGIVMLVKRQKLPKDRPDVDDKAICSKRIDGDGYGEILYEYKGRKYAVNAVSANETDIDEGEKVTVVHKEEGFCFVEREDEEIVNE
ncbi:MAG: hypothetical protein HDT44_09710 [Ruminococcaceae bacterium]|nr:hypothetical protein [Oscillospiraceae bacterium]